MFDTSCVIVVKYQSFTKFSIRWLVSTYGDNFPSKTKKNSNKTSQKWLEYKISSLFFESFCKCQNCYATFWKFRGVMPPLFARLRWSHSQSHTNNGFFKLVEPLLRVYLYLFSHSIKLREYWHTAEISRHCLVALPAKDVYAQQSHATKRLQPQFDLLPYILLRNKDQQ